MSLQDSLTHRAEVQGAKSLSAHHADTASFSSDSTAHRGPLAWRIAERMGDCTPRQIDSVIQAHLPQRERIRSSRPDTLSLPGLPGRKAYEAVESTHFSPELYQGFFRSNTLLHPELPYRSMGQSAVPVPYRLSHDDLVTSALIFCILILIYVLNKTRRQLMQQTHDFFVSPRERTNLFGVETGIEVRSRLFNILLLSLMGGLSMFAYAQYELQFFLGQLSPRWLLGIYVTSFLLFFFIKRILSSFVNWIFFPKSQQKIWNKTFSYLISVESLLFFPLLLTFVYFQLPFEKAVWIFLFILLTIKILLAFKTFTIFFPKSYCLFHLFAYLCALEIMPLLALWKSLAIVTENLIVKY